MINVSFYSNLNIVQVDNHNPPLSGTMIIIIHLDTRYDDLNLGGRAYFGGHNASAYLSIGTFSYLSCKSPYCYFWISYIWRQTTSFVLFPPRPLQSTASLAQKGESLNPFPDEGGRLLYSILHFQISVSFANICIVTGWLVTEFCLLPFSLNIYSL